MVAADASVNVRLQTVCKSELRSLCGGDDPDADHGYVELDQDFVTESMLGCSSIEIV